MTLHINEAEVRQLLTMPMAVAAVEEISRKQAEGSVVVHPRRRFELPGGGFFHYMAAMDTDAGYVGMKQYTYVKGKLCFLVPLYEIATGNLVALIEADYMGQQRTGAASGVATKYLAKKTARVAGILGTGGQAKTQLEAINTVRLLESAYVYGRDPQRRNKFCDEMSERLGISVYPMESAAAAVGSADVISTATTSAHPVLHRRRLAARGAHQCDWSQSRAQTRTGRCCHCESKSYICGFAGTVEARGWRSDPSVRTRAAEVATGARTCRVGGRQSAGAKQRFADHAIQIERDRFLGSGGGN